MNHEEIALNNFLTKLTNSLNELKDDFNKLSPQNKEKVKDIAQKEISAMIATIIMSS